MATKIKKKKVRLTISKSLFGVENDRADELTKIVETVMKEHASDEAPDSKNSVQEVADHWQEMFGDMITFGRTENERMWIVFVFSNKYTEYVHHVKQVKQMQRLFGNLLK